MVLAAPRFLPRHRHLLASIPWLDHPDGPGAAPRPRGRVLRPVLLRLPPEYPRRHHLEPRGGSRTLRLVGAAAPHLPDDLGVRVVPERAARTADHGAAVSYRGGRDRALERGRDTRAWPHRGHRAPGELRG